MNAKGLMTVDRYAPTLKDHMNVVAVMDFNWAVTIDSALVQTLL